jgi:hypothetical protein
MTKLGLNTDVTFCSDGNVFSSNFYRAKMLLNLAFQEG